ncbi:hypothetical protein DRO91_01385 [Candidatus Heimdallarchaeota archaeon]|nr:MAG: hypothetical protein DRP02_06460 [Candidatus Gerdarchaeota archaeon]RLI74088.1 MAG: hypothetical protein DRO91_01385 [Candidatus Heimdallarchaeota archaeon]
MKYQENGAVYYLTKAECAIYYFFLNRFFTQKSSDFSGGQKALARLIGFHENSVLHAVTSLEAKGWLERIRQWRKNILRFTPPKQEFRCRLRYCSGVDFGSYDIIELEDELQTIVANLEAEVKALEEELASLQKRQRELQEKQSQITKKDIIDFVDNLLTRLDDRFDPLPLKEKILQEIQLFRKKLFGESSSETEPLAFNRSLILNCSDWNPEEVLAGFKEIEELRAKK